MTVWAALALLASAAAPVACPHAGNSVVVDTATRVLVLCEAGSPTRTFGVHLGRGGVGKRTAGDEKVPLGMFELGVPDTRATASACTARTATSAGSAA